MTRPAYVWVFDQNRRRYAEADAIQRAKGHSFTGPPIWREHWRKVDVIGETSRSWVIGLHGGRATAKVPKRGADPRRFLLTDAELDEAVWAHDHRHEMSRYVAYRATFAELRAVAAAIGYTG